MFPRPFFASCRYKILEPEFLLARVNVPTKHLMIQTVKAIGRRFGLEIRRSKRSIGNMESFLSHLKSVGFTPRRILDVGAHKGDWSRLAHRYFPKATFVMIEPQVEMAQCLDSFCKEVPGSTWKLAGAGASPGEMELTVWPGFAGSSVLLTSNNNKSYERRQIPIITIDSLFEEAVELPQLAKLDIQGFELSALAGSTKLLGQTECFIVEVSLFKAIPEAPVFHDIVSFFHSHQYKVYDIPGHLRRPLDNALGQVDLAFVREGGSLDRDQRWEEDQSNER